MMSTNLCEGRDVGMIHDGDRFILGGGVHGFENAFRKGLGGLVQDCLAPSFFDALGDLFSHGADVAIGTAQIHTLC